MTDVRRFDKTQIRDAFERAAPTYDGVAVLQREVADRLLERLDFIRLRPQRILDLGAGTGYAIPLLQRRYPGARIVSLDLAHGMLLRARERFGFMQRLIRRPGFVCGDAERLPFADGTFDLVFSSLTLQWCEELDAVFAELQRVLRPGGLLMFTTLGPDTLHELRSSWAAADSDVHVNSFIDMHHVGDAMVHAGIADPVLDNERLTITYEDGLTILKDLKQLGAHTIEGERKKSVTGKGRLRAMLNHYESFRQQGRLPVSYEVVYGHGWRGERERRSSPGVVTVDIDQIQRR